MTLHEIAREAYNLSTDKKVNGIHYKNAKELAETLRHWLPKHTDNYIAQMTLPDGDWYVQFERSGDWYWFFVPETRKQEDRLIANLIGGDA